MKTIDRVLQNWRIDKAKRYIPNGASVLDVGCADAALFKRVECLGSYVGLDPHPDAAFTDPKMCLIQGTFPHLPEGDELFDCITMLACLEHVPEANQPKMAKRCFSLLKEGGKLIVTVPDAKVDRILDVLAWLKMIDGMDLDEHYHFDASSTPKLFRSAGLRLVKHRRFQLTLNNLFVFEKQNQ